jgi:hypothetical protein
MQNRYLTAMMMAVGGALAKAEVNGFDEEASHKIIEDIGTFFVKLVRGEIVDTDGGYPPMKLSGDNMVAEVYTETAAQLINVAEGPSMKAQMGGYNE